MAHLAGVYCHDPGESGRAERLLGDLVLGLGRPRVSYVSGPVRVGLIPQYPDERLLSLPRLDDVDARLGFGGDSYAESEGRAAPPWLRCRYEERAQRLTLSTDRYGFALVYSRRLGNCTAFSTSASALGRLPPTPRRDPSALAELLAFDHLLGTRTHRIEISATPAGHALELTASGAVFRKTHTPSDIRLDTGSRSIPAERILASLHAAMSSALEAAGSTPLLVPRSGGLDSRLLGALATAAGARPATFTFGGTRGRALPPDVQIGQEVARCLGLDWRFHELATDWLVDHARTATQLTDGHLNVLHSSGVSVVEACSGDMTRLDGIGGDVLFGGAFLRGGTFRRIGREARLRELVSRYDRLGQEPWRSLLVPHARSEVAALARAALGESLDVATAGCKDDDPRWFDFWVLENRTRRFINNGPLLWQARTRSTFAFLVPDLVDRLLALHPRERARGRLQHLIFREAWPELAAIPWQKTGRPLGQGGFKDRVAQLVTRAPYEKGRGFFDFDVALASSARMQNFFRQLLLDPRSGINRFDCFARASVERLLEDSIRGMRRGMRALTLLASVVLADQHWSTPLP